MKYILSFVICLLFSLFTRAQVQFFPSQLDFGEVTVGQSDSLKFELTTTGNEELKGSIIESTHPHFEAKIISQENSKIVVQVNFTPLHNVLEQAFIRLTTPTRFGSLTYLVRGVGKYANPYYNSTQNKSEEELKAALKLLIGGHTSLGYTTARDEMYADIDNTNGQVECVYTGRKATFNTRQGANNNGFNCEHTWPQGTFNQNEPMLSDIHHLYPTDTNAKTQRENLKFGTVSSPVWEAGGSKKGNSVFEPKNPHKGTVARSLFYFLMRYQNYDNFFDGQEETLRNWAQTYPADSVEISRNDAIFSVQNNRNPFIDHPEFLDRITTLNGTSIPDDSCELNAPHVVLNNALVAADDEMFIELANTGNTDWTVSSATFSGSTSLQFGDQNLFLPVNISAGERSLFKLKGAAGPDLTYFVLNGQCGGNTFADTVQLSTLFIGVAPTEPAKQIEYRVNKNKNLHIHWPSAQQLQVQIVNSVGQEMVLNEQFSAFTDISLQTYAAGVYFVKVFNGTHQQVFRIYLH